MRKPLMVVTLMGMGYLLSITPSVWRFVVYSIPILSLCMLAACIRAVFKSKDDTP